MQEREVEMRARIEAALYASGRPLSVEEIQKAAGTDSASKAVRLARELATAVDSNLRALEIIELPDGGFVMQLKMHYNNVVKRFATRPFLSQATLKTLSCVAYMQPVSSKQTVEVRGSQAYEHLKVLAQAGFLSYQKVGRLKIYQTTKKFQEYFGVDGDISSLKKQLLKKEGVAVAPSMPPAQLAQPIISQA